MECFLGLDGVRMARLYEDLSKNPLHRCSVVGKSGLVLCRVKSVLERSSYQYGMYCHPRK
jgi:hypothetical protein